MSSDLPAKAHGLRVITQLVFFLERETGPFSEANWRVDEVEVKI